MPFPLSPSVGDTYTQENTLFVFNGDTWDRKIVRRNNKTDYANTNLIFSLSMRVSELEALLANTLLVID
jgi:hypothetical protein